MASIIDRRIAALEEDAHLSKIAELEEVAEHMTKDAEEDVAKATTKARRQRQERRELENEFQPKRKKMLKLLARVSANPRTVACAWLGRKYLARLPGAEASYDQPLAKSLLPLGAHIWEGRSSRAWCAHLQPHKRNHCAWKDYGGNRPAMLACVAEVWTLFLKDKGMRTEQCPIPGLPGFDE